jgi:hypothetical protein
VTSFLLSEIFGNYDINSKKVTIGKWFIYGSGLSQLQEYPIKPQIYFEPSLDNDKQAIV